VAQCILSERQKGLLRSIVPGLKDGSVETEWVVYWTLRSIRIRGLSDEIWTNVWKDKIKPADFDVFAECGYFIEKAEGKYSLVEQAIIEAVDRDFSVASPPKTVMDDPGAKLKYRHLSEEAKNLAVKLVQHKKSGKISWSVDFILLLGDDTILGVIPVDAVNDIQISPDELRLFDDLNGVNLLGVEKISQDELRISFTQSLLDAVEDNFSELEPVLEKGLTVTPKKDYSSRVFVVHGHDNEIKQSVARVLEKLGLEVIILHEQPNKGRTVIEKFIDYSDVGFAIVLLTPDDVAYPKSLSPDDAKFRARQNVILELGYFLGKLERNRVFVLYREQENFEIPSDYTGVLYTAYDPANRWQIDMARELQEAGYEVDLNLIS